MWITASVTHLDATLVALIGIVSLLYMGTITWRDVSTNTNAVKYSHYFQLTYLFFSCVSGIPCFGLEGSSR